MKKSIWVGLILVSFFFIASTSSAYQGDNTVLPYRDLSRLMNPLLDFSGVRSFNDAIFLDRLRREILYSFITLLRLIENAIQDKIGAPTNNSFGRIVEGEPRKNKGNSPNFPATGTPEGTPLVSQPSSSTSSSGKIKIAIIDICPEHAARVKAVMEARIRQENPGADVEIRTIILPGEWQADGSKAVAGSAILSALGEAKVWGARVINMSIGSRDGLSQPLLVALSDLRRSGILVVAASGNDYGAPDAWGQAVDAVLSVGALNEYGQRQPYSNYADIYVPVAGRFQGTSFAAPVVAAEAALLLARNPLLSVDDLMFALGSSGDSQYASVNGGSRVSNNFYGVSLPFPKFHFEGFGFISPQYSNSVPAFLW